MYRRRTLHFWVRKITCVYSSNTSYFVYTSRGPALSDKYESQGWRTSLYKRRVLPRPVRTTSAAGILMSDVISSYERAMLKLRGPQPTNPFRALPPVQNKRTVSKFVQHGMSLGFSKIIERYEKNNPITVEFIGEIAKAFDTFLSLSVYSKHRTVRPHLFPDYKDSIPDEAARELSSKSRELAEKAKSYPLTVDEAEQFFSMLKRILRPHEEALMKLLDVDPGWITRARERLPKLEPPKSDIPEDQRPELIAEMRRACALYRQGEVTVGPLVDLGPLFNKALRSTGKPEVNFPLREELPAGHPSMLPRRIRYLIETLEYLARDLEDGHLISGGLLMLVRDMSFIIESPRPSLT